MTETRRVLYQNKCEKQCTSLAFIIRIYLQYFNYVTRDLAVYNSIFKCKHFLLKKIESSLKMAPKDEAETCSWE